METAFHRVANSHAFGEERILPDGRNDHSAPRLIGLPLPLSLPKLKGVRSRYCNRYDEQPAALLAASLLRLGIANPPTSQVAQ